MAKSNAARVIAQQNGYDEHESNQNPQAQSSSVKKNAGNGHAQAGRNRKLAMMNGVNGNVKDGQNGTVMNGNGVEPNTFLYTGNQRQIEEV
jgi:hypothetical protein